MDLRGRLRSVFFDNRIISAAKSDSARITTYIGGVALLMTLGAAGILSGVGLFILMMVQMEALAVVGSALLLAVSTAVFLSCYLWLTA